MPAGQTASQGRPSRAVARNADAAAGSSFIAGERKLRRLVRDQPGLSVLTRGQTGVDTAAALAALRAGLTVHLILPRGLLREDGALTGSRRRELSGAQIHELTSAEFRYRTWTVYLSDAVVLADPAGGEGCEETARAANRLGRPLLRLGPASPRPDPARITSWLERVGARVLTVAGCRASLLNGCADPARLDAHIAAVITGAGIRHDQLLRPTSQ